MSDPTFRSGQFATRALTWGSPMTMHFDNLLVTTSPAATGPPEVLLSDNFDDPQRGVLSTSSSSPARVTRGYADGEYVLRTVNPEAGTAVAPVPLAVANVSLAIDARIMGDVQDRYAAITCRLQPEDRSRYELLVHPNRGVFSLSRWDDGIQTSLVVQTSQAVKRGNESNRIELSCVGATLTAYMNNVQVAIVQDSTYTDGLMDIRAGRSSGSSGTVEARFDNLVVTQR